MDEKIVESAMQLIFFAGNAKSDVIKAIRSAEAGDFSGADKQMASAKSQIGEAHKLQTSLMTQEMNDGVVEKTFILIHAQDHFIGAVTSIDLGERIISLNKRVTKLERKLNSWEENQ
ncbi:PTS lactose/cellobiose transporter subunit IIA [Enterococcus sp. AZ196]|uniref:PTS lactose/cellobiose transporter subunit IIA n=1 Tax=Enterococcus sp. AZ196 TaxID=2774659 RepID=UPI003D28C92E